MATFPILIVQFFFYKINRVQAVDEIDKLCKFHKILTTNGYFSLTDCLIFFFKICRVQAVDDIDILCKFHENLTTNAHCITYTRNANFQLKMATFPLLICPFPPPPPKKINRVHAVDDIDKLASSTKI